MGSSPDRERVEQVAPGVYRFDTQYQRARHTACYIVGDGGAAAIVDCGVTASIPPLLQALEALEIPRESVEYVVPTHVHLDHAGGAGALMQALPRAQLAIHPSGAPHMIDPSRLVKGARGLFGDEFVDREYEPIEPVPAERVVEAGDEAVLDIGGRELRVLHTPGHAWHHLSLEDPHTATVIAGDAFGLAYPELVGMDGPFVIPPTAPPQLAPEAMHTSIDRIAGLEPARVLPAHFAVIDEPQRVAGALHRVIDEWLELCLEAASREDLEERLGAACAAELERRGRGGEIDTMQRLCGMDLWLNAQGLWYWRGRRAEREAAGGGEKQ